MLWDHLQEQATEQGRQLRGEGEQAPLVEIMMDTEEIDAEMDMTVVEQGILPEAPAQSIEATIYDHLVTFKLNNIQWRFEALTYLVLILETNQKACSSGDETRTPKEAYPKLWAYLGFRNLLTRYEIETGKEDPNTSAAAQFGAAERVHKTWLKQNEQRRARKLSQSPSSSRSRVDTSKPPMVCIRYDHSLAGVLFSMDYDEDDSLMQGISLFSPDDSDNDVNLKLMQLQELCAVCGWTPADELDQNTKLLLRTFGFGDNQPKRKLMVFLGMRKNKNARALQTASNESTARDGLTEVATEGVYEIDVNNQVESAVIELRRVHTLNIPNLATVQESIREQTCVRIWQACEDALFNFTLDEHVDRKMFKRGWMAAKFAAKFNLRERLPKMHDAKEWAKRRAVVDDYNACGRCFSYWDHLPTREWTPPFDSEIKEQAYVSDFNGVCENYLELIHAFIR